MHTICINVKKKWNVMKCHVCFRVKFCLFRNEDTLCACMLSHLSFVSALCNPVDLSPSGFSVHGLLQARVLEWIAISLSKASFWPQGLILLLLCLLHWQVDSLPLVPPGKPEDTLKIVLSYILCFMDTNIRGLSQIHRLSLCLCIHW